MRTPQRLRVSNTSLCLMNPIRGGTEFSFYTCLETQEGKKSQTQGALPPAPPGVWRFGSHRRDLVAHVVDREIDFQYRREDRATQECDPSARRSVVRREGAPPTRVGGR